MAEEEGIFPFNKFVGILKAHWSGIVNYIESQIANGVMEGINSKIQLAKRRARGYRTNFINMIYFIAGKLKFNYPQYSTWSLIYFIVVKKFKLQTIIDVYITS
jgi:transposase